MQYHVIYSGFTTLIEEPSSYSDCGTLRHNFQVWFKEGNLFEEIFSFNSAWRGVAAFYNNSKFYSGQSNKKKKTPLTYKTLLTFLIPAPEILLPKSKYQIKYHCLHVYSQYNKQIPYPALFL